MIVTEPQLNKIQHILNAYRLRGANIGKPQKGYRNSSFRISPKNGENDLNFVLYKTEKGILDRIRLANDIGLYLHRRGLPARYPVDRIVKVSGNGATRYAAIYNYLLGNTIPWEAYTKDHLKILGETMAKMHAVLESFDTSKASRLKPVIDEYVQIYGRMNKYFNDQGVRSAMANKLELAISPTILDKNVRLLNIAGLIPKQQALHMDFVRGNVLFQCDPESNKPVITGILDFEKASRGPVVFDVARTLAFLMVDCKYKPLSKVQKYFLTSGYLKYGGGKLLPAEKQLLVPLTNLFLLYDFYKFLRHNPYESLSQNEHFTRTRDILLQRLIIKAV